VDGIRFIIEVIDSGLPFDMASVPAPDVTADISERKLGLTFEEKLMKQLGVENGERAKYIDQQIMKLPEGERRAYYAELRDKKIISDEVAKQIKKLRQK
jgi:hypothetical protein